MRYNHTVNLFKDLAQDVCIYLLQANADQIKRLQQNPKAYIYKAIYFQAYGKNSDFYIKYKKRPNPDELYYYTILELIPDIDLDIATIQNHLNHFEKIALNIYINEGNINRVCKKTRIHRVKVQQLLENIKRKTKRNI